MSRRFGRKQRRKLRAEKAELVSANNILNRKIADLEYQIDQVAYNFGQFCALMPPKTLAIVEDRDFVRVYGRDKVIRDLWVMSAQAEFDHWRAMMHVRVSVPGRGSVGYAMSREMIEQAPEEMIVKHVSEEIARELVRVLRERRDR